MSFILKNGKGLYLVEDTDHRRYWGRDLESTIRFSSSTLAEREADFFHSENGITVMEYNGPISHHLKPLPCDTTFRPSFGWYCQQASNHLRTADQFNPQSESDLKRSLTHAKLAVAMLELALAKNQGELF